MIMLDLLQPRSVRLLAWVLLVLIPTEPLTAAFRQGQDTWDIRIKEAETKFYAGDFDSSIAILQGLLKTQGFPVTKMKAAYELLAQDYLAKNSRPQARDAIRKLLRLDPRYAPPTDTPEYAAEVERVRKDMSAAREKHWYQDPLVYVAAGVAVAAVVVILATRSSK